MEVHVNGIYSFKMNSGEEIVGKITEIVDNNTITPHYVVESPLATGMTQQGVQLMPALFTIDLNSVVNIAISSIAMTAYPREDLVNAYRESTTGIKVPDKQIILG